MKMHKNQGFTLIELIAVIAILAILAATAIPQFVDLRREARIGATNAVAGAVASYSAMNYAKKVAGSAHTNVNNCDTLIGNQTIVTGANIVAGAPAAGQYGINTNAIADGATSDCVLTNGDDNTVTVTFKAIGATP
jgi:MSHA pilin protein MshA